MDVLESPVVSPQPPPALHLTRRSSRRPRSRKTSESEVEVEPSASNSEETFIHWDELARSQTMYSPRFDHGVVRKGNRIYLFGGDTGKMYSTSQYLGDFFKFDLEGVDCRNIHNDESILCDPQQKWVGIRVKSTAPAARAGHAMVAHRKRIHVYGGVGEAGKFDDFWSYDPDLNVWGRRALGGDITPPARSHHTSLLHKNAMIVYGGSAYEGNGVVWSLDMSTLIDSAVTNGEELPRCRALHTAAIFEDCLYVFGGVMIDSIATPDELTDELWCFDLNTMAWTNLTPDLPNRTNWPRKRASHASVVIGNQWIIHGGRTHQPCPSTPFSTSEFKQKSEIVFESHPTPSLSSLGSQIPLGDVWAFNFSTKTWECLSNRSKTPSTELPGNLLDHFTLASRWGHDLVVCRNTKDSKGHPGKSQRSVFVTGGVTLAPLPLY
ncbi:leucine-zipper-like transcriptional regulator 1 homolog [Condylostylus longicornis]|uniref:leucine-zipper-like transcriptional regulator 1 homolog n=1 Tax=Condylostylus longicornis TaxID=2530218 RepID=UPI00244DC2A1|nr:leucine-zipper-like transcriptional regulator 1 homolog [Condylostylus longicornis]